ncbi:MAG: hypothetical protein AAFY72_06170, partial [Cyanobacteria bacterium J06649_4]
MSDPFLDIVTYNKNALNNLRRAVVLGQGQFSLILARANYEGLRQVLLTELTDYLDVEVVPLPPTATSLREAILKYQGRKSVDELSLARPDNQSSGSVVPFRSARIARRRSSSSEKSARVLMLTGLEDLAVNVIPPPFRGENTSPSPSALE